MDLQRTIEALTLDNQALTKALQEIEDLFDVKKYEAEGTLYFERAVDIAHEALSSPSHKALYE
jgi:CHASE3 domain sensor protein